MTIDEIKQALIGKELFVGGEWNSEGIVEDLKLVEFEGEEYILLYEKKFPKVLWCWFPKNDIEDLINGEGVYGGQPDCAHIELKNWI